MQGCLQSMTKLHGIGGKTTVEPQWQMSLHSQKGTSQQGCLGKIPATACKVPGRNRLTRQNRPASTAGKHPCGRGVRNCGFRLSCTEKVSSLTRARRDGKKGEDAGTYS